MDTIKETKNIRKPKSLLLLSSLVIQKYLFFYEIIDHLLPPYSLPLTLRNYLKSRFYSHNRTLLKQNEEKARKFPNPIFSFFTPHKLYSLSFNSVVYTHTAKNGKGKVLITVKQFCTFCYNTYIKTKIPTGISIDIEIMENEFDSHYGYELTDSPELFICDYCKCLLFEVEKCAKCACDPIARGDYYDSIYYLII